MSARDNYKYYRDRHRCVICHKQDDSTLAGRAYCAECAERRSEYYRGRRQEPERRKKQIEYFREHRKQWYAKRKAEHRCLSCQRLVRGPHSRCAVCRAKARERYRAAHRHDDGLCSRCHQYPKAEGRKLCEKCYRKAVEALKLARKARSQKRRQKEEN